MLGLHCSSFLKVSSFGFRVSGFGCMLTISNVFGGQHCFAQGFIVEFVSMLRVQQLSGSGCRILGKVTSRKVKVRKVEVTFGKIKVTFRKVKLTF